MSLVSSLNISKPHIVLFPFMSKGHIIPLLQLAKLLLQRNVRITIFTTPSNHSFVSESLPATNDLTAIIDLPFPDETPEVPHGVESTDKLPSMSLIVPFTNATKLMQPAFEKALEDIHKEVACVISDGFLPWTLDSASRFYIPRLSFYGMSYYAMAVSQEAMKDGLMFSKESPDEPFALPSFPSIELTRNHFDEPFDKKDPRGPHLDMVMEFIAATNNSYGLIVNSFYELEKTYADHYNLEPQPRAWSIGPLCLAQSDDAKSLPKWIAQWLDEKLSVGKPVIYVAFGSQAKISPEQTREIALGLEDSRVGFLWVVKKTEYCLNDDFESRVEDRGIVVKEWVDQRQILEHEAVGGFLSHCGWNSVLEGMCAEKPILAWPMMADQFVNAKMVEEEIEIGLRVKTVGKSPKGFVTKESLKSSIIELMESERGKQLKLKAKFLAEKAKAAAAEGGSSWNNLSQLLDEMVQKQMKERKGLI